MKIIQSKSDLAINGAPPAFTEPLHVGKPNIGDKEVFKQHVDDIFDRGWLTNNGIKVQEVKPGYLPMRLSLNRTIIDLIV